MLDSSIVMDGTGNLMVGKSIFRRARNLFVQPPRSRSLAMCLIMYRAKVSRLTEAGGF
jgi:hypothetical protein